MTRRLWTEAELEVVRRGYPDQRTCDLAKALGRGERSVYQAAYTMGLRKSAAFMASDKSGRVQRGKQDPRMRATQFRKNMTPWNKGKKCRPGRGANHPNARRTQFKAGCMCGAAQHNYQLIGTERISKEGYLERKVTDAGDTNAARQRRWVAVHRLVWIEAHGPIPEGHLVVFKPGCRTTKTSEITAEKLELIDRVENLRRNSRHTRYPPEVNQLMQLKGALKRKIKNRSKTK